MSDKKKKKKSDRESSPDGFSYGHGDDTRTPKDSGKPKVKVHTDNETGR